MPGRPSNRPSQILLRKWSSVERVVANLALSPKQPSASARHGAHPGRHQTVRRSSAVAVQHWRGLRPAKYCNQREFRIAMRIMCRRSHKPYAPAIMPWR